MEMSNLVKCIECNHEISTTARKCPRCGSDYPHGVICSLCHDKIKHSQAVCVKGYVANIYDCYYYHSQCMYNLLSIPYKISCRDCNVVIDNSIIPIKRVPKNFQERELWWPSCSNCGREHVLEGPIPTCYHYNYHQFCSLCNLPIYGFHPYEKLRYQGDDRTEEDFFHKHCVQQNQVIAERIQHYKETQRDEKEEK